MCTLALSALCHSCLYVLGINYSSYTQRHFKEASARYRVRVCVCVRANVMNKLAAHGRVFTKHRGLHLCVLNSNPKQFADGSQSFKTSQFVCTQPSASRVTEFALPPTLELISNYGCYYTHKLIHTHTFALNRRFESNACFYDRQVFFVCCGCCDFVV